MENKTNVKKKPKKESFAEVKKIHNFLQELMIKKNVEIIKKTKFIFQKKFFFFFLRNEKTRGNTKEREQMEIRCTIGGNSEEKKTF